MHLRSKYAISTLFCEVRMVKISLNGKNHLAFNQIVRPLVHKLKLPQMNKLLQQYSIKLC